MACTEWEPLLAARLYEEIDPADLRRVEEHLASCEECRAGAERLEESRLALRDGAPEVPAAPRLLILAPSAGGRAAWAFAAGIACAALLGAGAYAGYRAGSAPAPPATASAPDAALREELGRRLDALEAKLERTAPPASTAAAGTAPLTAKDLKEALDRLEKRTASDRAADLDYLLTRMAASEQRTGLETRQALRYVALASNPAFTAK